MQRTISGVNAFVNGHFVPADITIEDGVIVSITPRPSVDLQDNLLYAMPGFTDVHVHLREPGFSYKETMVTGTLAAAHGGYTSVCAMPNLIPVPDCMENLRKELEIIRRDARIKVHPYGTITRGEAGRALSEMEEMAPYVVAFSDDGHGVQSEEIMRLAMQKSRALCRIIAAHCEDNALLRGGCIHDGAYARANGFKGICSESEWGPIARDLSLVRQTGCAYHVCHISTRESVALIRQAKKEGLNVTCETAPHYLLLTEDWLRDEGRFKMNPPIRSLADNEALLEGLADGTIDMIATDHAPHAAHEKARGLVGSAMGIVGLETAFPLLYTHLVRAKKLITPERLVQLMTEAPCRRFGLDTGLEAGKDADITLYDLNRCYRVDPQRFISMGKATPFEGWQVFGACVETICRGETVWSESSGQPQA